MIDGELGGLLPRKRARCGAQIEESANPPISYAYMPFLSFRLLLILPVISVWLPLEDVYGLDIMRPDNLKIRVLSESS